MRAIGTLMWSMTLIVGSLTERGSWLSSSAGVSALTATMALLTFSQPIGGLSEARMPANSSSTDIVDWLRNAPSDEWCSPMLNKAADEIDRLRDVVVKLQATLAARPE
jgi:hypothetical protein